jgi:hypothetical protein
VVLNEKRGVLLLSTLSMEWLLNPPRVHESLRLKSPNLFNERGRLLNGAFKGSFSKWNVSIPGPFLESLRLWSSQSFVVLMRRERESLLNTLSKALVQY